MDFPTQDPQRAYKQAAVRLVGSMYGEEAELSDSELASRYLITKRKLFELSRDYIDGTEFPVSLEEQEGGYRAVGQMCIGFITTASEHEDIFFIDTVVYDEFKKMLEDVMPEKEALAERLIEELCPEEYKHKVYSPFDTPYEEDKPDDPGF